MRAKGLRDVASYTYTQLISQVQGSTVLPTITLSLSLIMQLGIQVTEDVVKQWIEDEKTVICTAGKSTSKCIAVLLDMVDLIIIIIQSQPIGDRSILPC